MTIEIVFDYPPNYKEIANTFTLSGNEIFAYDKKIYAPRTKVIPPELIAHEVVHFKQQEITGVETWWSKYLIDNEFRLEQELESHIMEYRAYCSLYSDRNARAKYLDFIATRLSSKMYGNVLSKQQAKKKINGTRI